MDMVTLTTAVEGIKLAKEVFNTLLQLKIDAAAKEKVNGAMIRLGEVQDTLFLLREQLLEIQEKNRALQSIINESEKWEQTISGYQLTTTPGGAVVFQSLGDPTHYICPSCSNQHERHILQDDHTIAGNYSCPGCKTRYPIKPRGSYEQPEIVRA